MATDRARPAQDAGEREMLTGWLEHHRGILIWKCEDLTAEQLRRRAVPPSTLSLLGLVRHMAEVERGWFRQVFLGENVPDLYDRSADEDADFNDIGQADPARRSMPSNASAPCHDRRSRKPRAWMVSASRRLSARASPGRCAGSSPT